MPNVPYQPMSEESKLWGTGTLTLMNVTVSPIRGGLPMSTVRRGTMIINIRVFLDNLGKSPLVDISRREVGLAEIGSFVGIVKVELERLGHLIIYGTCQRFD